MQVLLFAADLSARQVAPLLSQELGAVVAIVSDLRRYQETLQHKTFTLIVIEEAIAMENEGTLRSIYAAAAEALVLEVNFGISNGPRVLHQVRAALRRGEAAHLHARRSALISLQRELSAAVSGLLLESQLALRNAGPGVAPVLEHLVTLAESLCEQLRF